MYKHAAVLAQGSGAQACSALVDDDSVDVEELMRLCTFFPDKKSVLIAAMVAKAERRMLTRGIVEVRKDAVAPERVGVQTDR